MAGEAPSISALLGDIRRALFGVADIVRRAQGDLIGAWGLDPSECPYHVTASGPYWRLRDYGGESPSPLLVVAAPIKRPYIWDLAPAVSAIRCCLRQGLRVYLVEWTPASRHTGRTGLDECAAAISTCVAEISDKSSSVKPILMGHSLGGTLAAIYGAWAPDTVRAVALLSAPLCFRPHESPFRDALVSVLPSALSEAGAVPGSLLSQASALASPSTFIWSRLLDAAMSLGDRQALDIHARVERWALDEVPLPGKLLHQIVEWLYRENRLCRGILNVDGRVLSPSRLSVPVLAVVNIADQLVPLAAVKPFVDAVPTRGSRILEYPGEVGVSLQHVGILVGRGAHARIWPEILSWLARVP